MRSTRTSVGSTHVQLATFYALSIAVHLLIIIKLIPFDWVNGGRSETYRDQALQSVASIVVIGILAALVWRVEKTMTQERAWKTIALLVVTALWVIGFVMQLFGTTFERFVVSILLVLGVVAHVRLLRMYRSVSKVQAR